MEIVWEESAQVVGAELELQQDGDDTGHRAQGAVWVVPKHYDPRDSSEEEDGVASQVLGGGVGDCVCCVCGRRFAFLAHLIEHFAVHKSDVRCHLCQVTFPRVISLALHLDSHSGHRLFCSRCGVAFRTTWHMNGHMEKHTQGMEVRAPDALTPSPADQKLEEDEEEEEDVEEAIVENEEMDVKHLKEEEGEEEEDVKEAIVENEEMDVKYLKEEEQEMKIEDRDSPGRDHLLLGACKFDHNYFNRQTLPTPAALSERVRGIQGSTQETMDHVKTSSSETLYVSNNKSDTAASLNVSEPEVGQRETVEVEMLRGLKEGRKSASVSSPTELLVQVEEDYEKCSWEQGPIQEEAVKEEDEFSVASSDGDSLPPGDSAYTPEEDLHSDKDSVGSSSDSSGDDAPRRCKGKRSRATRGRRKRAWAVVGQKPLATATPEPLCSSCGLFRGPRGVGGRCQCEPQLTCCQCGLAQGSQEQLLKHQAEKHPSTKYVCASCMRIFNDHNIFTRHVCCSGPKAPPAPPPPAPTKNAGRGKNLPLMILNFVPPSSGGGARKAPLSTGDRAFPTILLTNNAIVNPGQKLPVQNSSLPVLPNKPSLSTNQSVPMQVMATLSLNNEQKVTGLVLKGVQSSGTPSSPVTRAETIHLNVATQSQVKVHTPAPPPAQMVFQGVVMSQHGPAPAGPPAHPPGCTPPLMASVLGPVGVPIQPQQSRVALRIPPCSPSTTVSVSFSPTPVQFPAPVLVSANGPKIPPLPLQMRKFDHNYFNRQTLPTPAALSERVCGIQGSTQETMDHVKTSSSETLYVNNKSDTAASLNVSEPEVGQRETVEVEMLRGLKEGRKSASTTVSVSFSPTPVQFPAPMLVSANGPKTPPLKNLPLARPMRPIVLCFSAPGPTPVPVCGPAPVPATGLASGPTRSPTPGPAPGPPPRPPPAPHGLCPTSAPAPLSGVAPSPSCSAPRLPSPAGPSSPSPTLLAPPPSQGPLKIVAMFVNQSQELALQKRLHQSWRSKAVFPCRQCGAVSRQPSLGVRHRYRHRGPRRHRCACGRAFQRLLHLLRHQVQHAEAVRYVCAACGRTFQGTRRLGRHGPDGLGAGPRRQCRNTFPCVCGQVFARPAALLWHMLKNSKSRKKRLKTFVI